MNQSLNDINDSVKGLYSEQEAVQSLLRRVDVLEQTPSTAEQHLAEYVRNFDATKMTLQDINTQVAEFNRQMQALMQQTLDTIKRKRVVIDAQTLADLEALVKRDTNFSLPKWIKQVQQEAIDKNFKTLYKDVDKHTDTLTTDINELIDRFGEQLKKNEKQAEQLNKLWFVIGIMAILYIVSALPTIVAHPIISLVVAVIVGIFAFIWFRTSKDTKDGDDDEGD